MKKVRIKRKLWVDIFGKYNFQEVVTQVAKDFNIEIIVGFKPDMMVDMHLGVKGHKKDIDDFKNHLIENNHGVFNRKPKTAFQFDLK
ncbi:hypothetical protein [Algoriella sp.]|uniref:hypothetical protein n=1 Tax=Algoriella sp. TaxID=1872434 RepID=UPI002FC86DE2